MNTRNNRKQRWSPRALLLSISVWLYVTVVAPAPAMAAPNNPGQPKPSPAPSLDLFDGTPSPEVDNAASNGMANFLLVSGGIGFILFVCGLILAASGNKHGKTMAICGALAAVVCLGPGAWMKFIQGTGNSVTG